MPAKNGAALPAVFHYSSGALLECDGSEIRGYDSISIKRIPRHPASSYIIENVPARVDEETAEQFFAPTTVERLQETILRKPKPDRLIETPVYQYKEPVYQYKE